MSDNTEPGGGQPRDPWAPPDSRVDLGKPAGDARPPAVHDQPTVTSMPSAGVGPGTGPIPVAHASAGFGSPQDAVPPPPIAPNGPGQGVPPAPQYGYPAAPAPAYGGYPGYPGYMGQPSWGHAPANGLGTAAMVLGIVGAVFFCLWGLGVILGIIALIFGIIGRGRAARGEANNGGMALAGIVLGSVAIVISAAFLGFLIWGVNNDGSGGGSDSDRDYEYNDPYATSLVVDITR